MERLDVVVMARRDRAARFVFAALELRRRDPDKFEAVMGEIAKLARIRHHRT